MNAIEIFKVFIQYVLPSLLGGSGLLAILYNWRIEKERQRISHRRDLVDSWRRELLHDWKEWDGLVTMGDLTNAITRSPAYASLRPHLTEAFRRKLEGRQLTLGGGYPRTDLIEEIGRIEREWKLV
jgi:hypothetical protein